MSAFTQCVGTIAPLYNIVLVLIVYALFYKLIRMKKNKKVFIQPWYLLFAAVSFFLLESIITAMKFLNIITEQMVPRWFNAVFELMMIVLIIYMLFMQVNHVSEKYKSKSF